MLNINNVSEGICVKGGGGLQHRIRKRLTSLYISYKEMPWSIVIKISIIDICFIYKYSPNTYKTLMFPLCPRHTVPNFHWIEIIYEIYISSLGFVFSSPEPKAQASHYHSAPSVLDRKQDLNVLHRVCVFRGRSEHLRWPAWSLIGRDNFDFFSKTAEQNSTQLDRKQDLNITF